MGKSYTPKYLVRLETFLSRAGRVSSAPFEYRVKDAGRPNVANLAKFVEVFENSCKPGGCNAHLGIDPVLSAVIYENVGKRVVAEWSRKSLNEPMFKVL
jgi:hypothetical protein